MTENRKRLWSSRGAFVFGGRIRLTRRAGCFRLETSLKPDALPPNYFLPVKMPGLRGMAGGVEGIGVVVTTRCVR